MLYALKEQVVTMNKRGAGTISNLYYMVNLLHQNKVEC
jgi:hypothetical protein